MKGFFKVFLLTGAALLALGTSCHGKKETPQGTETPTETETNTNKTETTTHGGTETPGPTGEVSNYHLVANWDDAGSASCHLEDENGTRIEEAQLSKQITHTEDTATCQQGGKITYTLKVTYKGIEYTSTHEVITGVKAHTPVLHEGVDPTCQLAGFEDYYECSDCHKYFADEECTHEIENLDAWRENGGDGYIAPLAHTLEARQGQEPEVGVAGFKAYFECTKCHMFFEDEQGTKIIGNAEALATWKAEGGDGYIAPLQYAFNIEVVWDEEGYTAKVHFTCDEDPTQNKVEEAQITYFDTESTCQTHGVRTYSAFYEKANGEKIYASTKKTEELPLGEHNFAISSFVYEEGKVYANVHCLTEGCEETRKEEYQVKTADQVENLEKAAIIGTITEINSKNIVLQSGEGRPVNVKLSGNDNLLTNPDEFAYCVGDQIIVCGIFKVSAYETAFTTSPTILAVIPFEVNVTYDNTVATLVGIPDKVMSHDTIKFTVELVETGKKIGAVKVNGFNAEYEDGYYVVKNIQTNIEIEVVTVELCKTVENGYVESTLKTGKLLITTTKEGNTYYLPVGTYTAAPKAEPYTADTLNNIQDGLWDVELKDDKIYISTTINGTKYYLGITSNGNNAIRTSTNELSWVLDGNALKSSDYNRYMGIYEAQDWRSYNSKTHTNYKESATSLKYYEFVNQTVTHHELVETPEVKANCLQSGHKAYYECQECHMFFSSNNPRGEENGVSTLIGDAQALAAWLAEDGEGYLPQTPDTHSLVKTDKVDASCIQAGHKAYWTCSDCGKNFADEAGTQEITDLAAWLAEGGEGFIAMTLDVHQLVTIEAKNPTCVEAGHKAYYICSVCHNAYADSEGTQLIGDETALNAWLAEGGEGYLAVTPNDHLVLKAEKVDPKCEEAGHQAYWYCGICSKAFKDEACTQEIADLEAWLAEGGEGYIAPLGHNIDVTFTWNKQNHTATYSYVCHNDMSDRRNNLEATVTSETVEATCYSEGSITYTASATIYGQTYTCEEKDVVVLQKLDHDYAFVNYVFQEGKWYAKYECKNEGCTDLTSETHIKLEETDKVFCAIGNIGFETLADAIASTEVGNIRSIKAIKEDITLTRNVTFETLDLDGMITLGKFNVEFTGPTTYDNIIVVVSKDVADEDLATRIIVVGRKFEVEVSGDEKLVSIVLAGDATIINKDGSHAIYATAMEAIEAFDAETAEKVVLNKDLTFKNEQEELTAVTFTKAFTLDMGGHTVTASELIISGDVKVTMLNGKFFGQFTEETAAKIETPEGHHIHVVFNEEHTQVLGVDMHQVQRHDLDAVEPTCTTIGYTAGYKCDVCGDIIEGHEVIPALGHQLTHHEAVAATCETAGNIEYWTCDRCNEFFLDSEGLTEITLQDTVIPALGHDYEAAWTWTDKEHVSVTFTCKNDPTHTETLDVSDRIFSEVTKAATCEETGLRAYKVTVEFNGNNYLNVYGHQDEMPALGHDMQVYDTWEFMFIDGQLNDVAEKCSRCDNKTYEVTTLHKTSDVSNSTYSNYETVVYGKVSKIIGSNVYLDNDAFEMYSPLSHSFTINVGDTVIGYGKVTEYKNQWEFAKNCEVLAVLTKTDATPATSCVDAGHGNKAYLTLVQGETNYYYYDEQMNFIGDEAALNAWKSEGGAGYVLGDHQLSKTEQVNPTCVQSGTKAYWTCSECGKHFADEAGTQEITDLTAWLAEDGAGFLAIDANAHAWDYEQDHLITVWADDFTKVTVTFTCTLDPSHTKVVECTNISSEGRAYTGTLNVEGHEYTFTKTRAKNDEEIIAEVDTNIASINKNITESTNLPASLTVSEYPNVGDTDTLLTYVWKLGEDVVTSVAFTDNGEDTEVAYTLIVKNGETELTTKTVTFTLITANNQFTVRFFNGDTQVGEDVVVIKNQTVTAPNAPEVDGKIFTNWATRSGEEGNYSFTEFDLTTPITANVDLYAQYANKVTVTFVNEETQTNVNIVEGTSVSRPENPTKEGYEFDGWYTSQDNGQTLDAVFDFDSPVNENITVYAKFTQLFTVTFNSLGGTAVDTQTVRKGATATVPTDPTKDGFTFGGWFTSTDEGQTLANDAYVFTETVNDNITLYAKWDEVEEISEKMLFTNNRSSDSSTCLTTQDLKKYNTEYATISSSSEKVYEGKNSSLKLGASGANGFITITTTKKVEKIVVEYSKYSNDSVTIDVSYGDKKVSLTPQSTKTNSEVQFEGDVTSFTIGTSAKRGYIYSIEIFYTE